MVKLEFENKPPTKEALEESQEAAVERVTGKKRTRRKTASQSVGDGSFAPLPVSESDPTKAVSTIEQPSIPSEIKTPPPTSTTIRDLNLAAQSRSSVIQQSFTPKRIDPSQIPTPTETTIQTGAPQLSAEELRQAGFEPIIPQGEIQPSTLSAPSPIFSSVREKLQPQTDTEPIKFKELPVAGAIVLGEAGVQFTEFTRGAILDPIQAIVNPAKSLQPIFETTAELATGQTTPREISRGISEGFIAEPARFAGNIAFDIASGKIFVGARTKAVSELTELRRAREFRSLVTDPEFKLPPSKTQVVSSIELPEGLTLADDVPRKELLVVKEEFSEGLLPVLDEPTGTVKELQSQLIADPNVKVTAEGLPVDKTSTKFDTAGFLEQQTEFPNVLQKTDQPISQVTVEEIFKPSSEKQLPLDSNFKKQVDITSDITVESTPKLSDASKPPSKVLATPDPVSALFQTAVDPEFISFTQKEFERLKRGTKKLQADIELPSSIPKKPDFEFPIAATSLGREPTVTDLTTTTFNVQPVSDLDVSPQIEQSQQPITTIEQGRGLTPDNIQIISVTPVQEVEPVIETRKKSRSGQVQDVSVIQEIVPEQSQEVVVLPQTITTPRLNVQGLQALRQQPRIVPKIKPRPKQKIKPRQQFFTVVIGQEGRKVFKTVRAGSLREAAFIGKRGVLGTAAASLEIKPEGRELSFEEESFVKGFLGASFRKSKVKKKKFVQKKETRISSVGEKREITFKGLGALGTKSGNALAESLISKGSKLRDVRRLL